MSKDTIFSGMSDAVKQTHLNLATPVLQENAETFSGDLRFSQLKGQYDNHAAKGGSGQAREEAEKLNAYNKSPQDLMDEHAKRVANQKPPSKSIVEQIPLWGWAVIAIGGWRLLTKRV